MRRTIPANCSARKMYSGSGLLPRHDEVEPALEEIRLATDDAAPCWW